jgi:hypothetical protein
VIALGIAVTNRHLARDITFQAVASTEALP